MSAHRIEQSLFSRRQVYQAAKIWSETPGYGGFRNSVHYDVRVGKRLYPPKAIVAIAYELASGHLLSQQEFAGALKGKWLRQLKLLKFEIMLKNADPKMSSNLKFKYKRKYLSNEVDLRADLRELIESKEISTEILTLILSRLGQGKFRKELLAYWGRRYAVTGVECERVLRAAHIVRWADCKNGREGLRTLVDNGLLLSANLDCLFEVGLIGFTRTGELIKSSKLTKVASKSLGVLPGMRLRLVPTKRQIGFLSEDRLLHKLPQKAYAK